MKAYNVTIREAGGQRWHIVVLAASSIDACLTVLAATGRVSGIGARPFKPRQ